MGKADCLLACFGGRERERGLGMRKLIVTALVRERMMCSERGAQKLYKYIARVFELKI